MRMRILSTQGVVEAEVRSWYDRSVIASHWNAVGKYVDTGAVEQLWDFEGVVIAGVELATDPDEIDAWWSSGQLNYIEIYI